MVIGCIERMEKMVDELQNNVISDGNIVWVEARDALEKAVAYQKAKHDAAMKKAYG